MTAVRHGPWRHGVDAEGLCEARQCARCGRVEARYGDTDGRNDFWLPFGECAGARSCRPRPHRLRVVQSPEALAALRAAEESL